MSTTLDVNAWRDALASFYSGVACGAAREEAWLGRAGSVKISLDSAHRHALTAPTEPLRRALKGLVDETALECASALERLAELEARREERLSRAQ